jgi:hypothetical protein
MNSLACSDTARTNYRVRRRRYSGKVWLIQHNKWFEIDSLFDCVWQAALAARSFEDVSVLTQRRFEWPLSECVASVSAAWATLRDCGLIEIVAANALIPERDET